MPVERDEAVKWFYRLFFRNLGIMNTERQNEIKRYIPLKAIILFDRLMIADADDNWHTYDPAGEKEYVFQYKGKNYKFTLSDQIFDIESGTWITDGDIGLEPRERKAMVTEYIISQLNSFLDNRGSGNNYKLVFSLNDTADRNLVE